MISYGKCQLPNQEIKRWDVGPSTFLALPEKGARLLNWHINMSDGSVRDIIHWPEEYNQDNFSDTHGGIPILFLLPGSAMMLEKKIFGDSGKPAYRCQCMDLRHSDFSIRSIDQHGFEVELIPTNETKAFFPFEYTFTVIFHFLELSLQISLVLENEGRETIPWSSGLHPYFQIPWRKDLSLKDHQIRLDAKKFINTKKVVLWKKIHPRKRFHH